MIDIYSRYDGDPNFEEFVLEVNDDFDVFVQQIEMVLTTNKTEVLGDHTFGGSLEDYIHSFNFNENQLKSEISNLINKYCTLSQKFNYSVDVKFFKGSIRDIGLIDIIVDGTKVFGILIR
jgi:hypothetical protein